MLDYLAHQRKLLPALAKTYALHFAQLDLVAGLHDTTPDLDEPQVGHPADHPDRRELEARAAGIKAIATWHATATIQACREACGGAGYLAENRLPGLKADTDVFTTFEGDNTVLLQLVAKELLTGYRDHFGELDLLRHGPLRRRPGRRDRWSSASAAGACCSGCSTPPRARRPRTTCATARGTSQLFDWREKHLLETLARRLRRPPSADDPFAVFNAAQDHLLAAARAHVDSVLLQAFVDGIERCPDGPERELLERVCDLFALSTIEAERGWFQEHGRLTTQRSKAVLAEVNALCELSARTPARSSTRSGFPSRRSVP